MRPTFEQTYMNMALELAKRSSCQRLQVGALLVSKDNLRVYGAAYNGSYPGNDSLCLSDKPGACGCTEHAEANLLLGFKNGFPSTECRLFVSTSPCSNCADLIIQYNIPEVFYKESYRNSAGLVALLKAGVKVEKLS